MLLVWGSCFYPYRSPDVNGDEIANLSPPGGAEPMAAPICNGFLWLYGKDAKDTFVPPNKKTTNVSAGDVYVRIMQDKRKEVNLVPYHLGKAGCGFAPVYRNGEYQYLDEDCGLVRKPVGKWTG